MQNKKCLVTGGAGFIGSNLVDALIRKGAQVVVVDDLSSGKSSYIDSRVKFYEQDITDTNIKDIFAKENIDIVFHLAGQISVNRSVEDPGLDNKINILGGLNILKNSHLSGVKKIVFASTGGAIYGDTDNIPTPEDLSPAPVSPYGINKLCFEHYLRYYYEVFSQDYAVLRLANVYGPRQYKGGETGVVSIFVEHAVREKECVVNGDGEQTRDFVYVDDVVSAFIKASESNNTGVFNIGNGREISVNKVVQAIRASLGDKIKVSYGPELTGEQRRSCLDNSLAKKDLGWRNEIDFTTGVRRTIDWTQKNIGF